MRIDEKYWEFPVEGNDVYVAGETGRLHEVAKFDAKEVVWKNQQTKFEDSQKSLILASNFENGS